MGILRTIWYSRFGWLFLLILLVAINILAASLHTRVDLTREKRYTLSEPSKQMLQNLDQPVSIDVFLKGDFPAGFQKLANSVDEFLAESKEYSNGKLSFRFIDPLQSINDSTDIALKDLDQSGLSDPNALQAARDSLNNHAQVMKERLFDSLSYFYDISPFTLQAPSKVGDELSIKQLVPGAVIHYRDTSIGINLLRGVRNYGTEPEQLARLYNDVEATLEYKFMSALQKATTTTAPLIGYLLGNGEAWGYNIDDAVRTLIKDYRFDTINLKETPYLPSDFNALVIAKPTVPFTDDDKFKIDQYVMRGGKIFWAIDNMYAEFDSLYQSGGFTAYDRGLNLEDLLFKYGVRLNQNLLQDMQSDQLGQTSGDPNNPQPRLVDWPFFPILNGTDNPITKNMDGVLAMFPNTLDTVQARGIRKSFLLRSSANARVLQAPAQVDFTFLQIAPDIKDFTVHDTTVAALLEGKFSSLYANRTPKSKIDSLSAWGVPFRNECAEPGQMIVVADGDIILNQFSQQYGALPMGYNFYTRYTYANKEFFTNSLEYLIHPNGILETRAKEYTLRLLDPVKVRREKTTWILVNIAVPVLLVILAGLMYQRFRKSRYAKAAP